MTTEVIARCQHDGCEVEGDEVVQCYIPDDTDQPAESFCAFHCFEHGYCWGCGYLWAGIEFFDYASDGLCEYCHDEFNVENEWAADDYEPYGESDPAYWRSQPVKLIP